MLEFRERSETTFAQRGEGGQLGAILCKLLRLEVYIKRGEGVKNLGNANVIYIRPLTTKVCP